MKVRSTMHTNMNSLVGVLLSDAQVLRSAPLRCSQSVPVPHPYSYCTRKTHEVVGGAPMVDQRPLLGLQLLCPHLALSLIDNFIAIRIPARRASRRRVKRRRLEHWKPCDGAARAQWRRIDGKAGLVALTNRLPTDRRRRGQRR